MAQVPDEELMLAYRGGDAGAFEILYARHRARLFRFILRSIKVQPAAEELYQEVWMRVIEARASYKATARFSTWLYTIAHHRLVDHWRGARAMVSLDDLDVPAHSPDPAQHAEACGSRPLGTSAGRPRCDSIGYDARAATSSRRTPRPGGCTGSLKRCRSPTFIQRGETRGSRAPGTMARARRAAPKRRKAGGGGEAARRVSAPAPRLQDP